MVPGLGLGVRARCRSAWISMVLWLGLGLLLPPPPGALRDWPAGAFMLSIVPELEGHLGLQVIDRLYSPAAPL